MGNPFDSTNLQNVPVRPLSKGMIQNLPSNGLPPGSFLRVQNYRVEESGLARRGGFINYDLNTGTGKDQYDEQILDIIYFYNRDPLRGAEQLLLTDRKLYKMQKGDTNESVMYRNINRPIETNTASIEGYFEVTIAGTDDEAGRLRPGDYTLIDGVEYPLFDSHKEDYIILKLQGDGISEDQFIGSTVTVDECFISEPLLKPSYAILPSVGADSVDKIIIVDQAERGPYEYSNGTLKPFLIDSTDGIGGTQNYVIGAKTVTYFDDRLWFGNTEEVDGQYRQRIRWTDAVNFDRIAPSSYTDLPYSEGQLLKLVPLGSLLVAYYHDTIYLGRRTNMSGQPYYFEPLETGNVGIVNARAVVRHTDTHYLVGSDNIYTLSGSAGYQPIGVPVLEEALFFTRHLELMEEIQVEHDPRTKSIAFLFPDKVEVGLQQYHSLATRLWRYYYDTKAWAYDEVSFADDAKSIYNYLFTGITPSNTYVYGRSWEDWADLGYDAVWERSPEPSDPDDPDYPNPAEEAFVDWLTWTQLSDSRTLGITMKIGVYSAPLAKELIVEEFHTAEQDTIGETDYPIWALIESGDTDTGIPDYTKTVTRLSIKAMHIYSERMSSLVEVGGEFTLLLSNAMGYRWKRPMVLRFKRNYNEGYANFRATGSTFRFKLINSQVIAPYRISEYVLRLVGRGLQVEN